MTCHTCRSPDTILNKETRLFFLQCMTCHSSCSVQTIKTGFQVRISSCRTEVPSVYRCVSGHHGEKKGCQGQGVTKSEREDLNIFRWRRKTFSYFILITNTQFPREKLTTKPSATVLILDKYLMGFLTPRLTRQFLVSIAHYSSRTFTNLHSRYC